MTTFTFKWLKPNLNDENNFVDISYSFSVQKDNEIS